MANYYPDFLVQTKDFIYIVETKAKKDNIYYPTIKSYHDKV